MIQKYNEIKEAENPTIGITRRFAENELHKKSIEKNQAIRTEEEKETERGTRNGDEKK